VLVFTDREIPLCSTVRSFSSSMAMHLIYFELRIVRKLPDDIVISAETVAGHRRTPAALGLGRLLVRAFRFSLLDTSQRSALPIA